MEFVGSDQAGAALRVAEALRAGTLVALPTETGYEIAAFGLDDAAVARLVALADPAGAIAVALASPLEAFDWVPPLRGPGLRLARDFWPGPLTLVCYGSGLPLPNAAREAVARHGGIALRCPDREDLGAIFRAVPGPVLLARLAQPSGAPSQMSDLPGVSVVFDGGLAPTVVPPTIVALGSQGDAALLFEGAVPEDDIRSASRCRVLFVCTGNTCRSPMAEGLCRRLLADTLGCAEDDLPAFGFEIASAGLAALAGGEATLEAADAGRAWGADLSRHRSQPLSASLLARADQVYAMTGGHLRMLRSLRLPFAPRADLLSDTGEDVPDPIGGPRELYEACAAQIRGCLLQRLPRILEG